MPVLCCGFPYWPVGARSEQTHSHEAWSRLAAIRRFWSSGATVRSSARGGVRSPGGGSDEFVARRWGGGAFPADEPSHAASCP